MGFFNPKFVFDFLTAPLTNIKNSFQDNSCVNEIEVEGWEHED